MMITLFYHYPHNITSQYKNKTSIDHDLLTLLQLRSVYKDKEGQEYLDPEELLQAAMVEGKTFLLQNHNHKLCYALILSTHFSQIIII